MTGQQIETRPLDQVFDSLRHPVRRQLLTVLLDVTASDDVAVEALPATMDGVDPTVIELHHVHLPKLDEMDYVEWDPGDRRVRRGPQFEEVASVIRTLRDQEPALPTDWR